MLYVYIYLNERAPTNNTIGIGDVHLCSTVSLLIFKQMCKAL